jgi:chromosomal replication initiation ATPase DnaA
MSARDLDLLASIFSDVYSRERDICTALRTVFAVDDARRGEEPIMAPEAFRSTQRLTLKEQKLQGRRISQLFLPFVDQVAKANGLERADLVGGSRLRMIAWPRQEAMWLIRQKTNASLPVIGAALGGRNHSTVVSGIRNFERRLKSDQGLRARMLGEGKAA